MFAATNIRMKLADKVHAIGVGGIGLVHQLAREIGLVDAIDRHLHLLKIHRPYHESDHVLNLAYNALCDGTRLEDIELRRNDEVFLDALGTERIPDPTTAGDFCRRFDEASILTFVKLIHRKDGGVGMACPQLADGSRETSSANGHGVHAAAPGPDGKDERPGATNMMHNRVDNDRGRQHVGPGNPNRAALSPHCRGWLDSSRAQCQDQGKTHSDQ
jgi:hypothetical protein